MADAGQFALSFQNPLEVIHHFAAPVSASVSAPRAAASANALTNAQLAMLGDGFFAMHDLQLDKALLARFLHLISGKQYSKVHNSEVYKKLRQEPSWHLMARNMTCLQALCTAYDLSKLADFIVSRHE